jgi:hypothetical protein
MNTSRPGTAAIGLSICIALLAGGCASAGSPARVVAQPPVVPGQDTSGPGLTGANLPAVVPNVSGAVSRPNLALTPGATATTDTTTVCSQPRHLSSQNIPSATQVAIYREYGYTTPAKQHKYGLDYLIPPDLGGAAVAANLWPAALRGIGYYQKHQLDRVLHDLVCHRSVPLVAAQLQIRANWYVTWLKYVVTAGRG